MEYEAISNVLDGIDLLGQSLGTPDDHELLEEIACTLNNLWERGGIAFDLVFGPVGALAGGVAVDDGIAALAL